MIAANFPDVDSFRDAYVRRLTESWQPRIPILPIFSRMIAVAEEIYEIEGLSNPVPPLPPDDSIEQGRYRDLLRIHALKMHDAPGTLGVVTEALTRSLKSFRDALPEAVLKRVEELPEETSKPALTMPLIDSIGNIGELTYDVAIAFYTEEIKELRMFESLKRQLASPAIGFCRRRAGAKPHCCMRAVSPGIPTAARSYCSRPRRPDRSHRDYDLAGVHRLADAKPGGRGGQHRAHRLVVEQQAGRSSRPCCPSESGTRRAGGCPPSPYGTPRQIVSSPSPEDGAAEHHPSDEVSPSGEPAQEPILNLHHPDLPWRLEDPPTPTSEDPDPKSPPPKPRSRRGGTPKKDDSKTEGGTEWR